jgi:hypothetical protein
MRTTSIFMTGCIALVLGAICAPARGQADGAGADEFEVPLNSLAYEDSGTLEMVQPDGIRIQDSKNETWLLTVVPQTKICVAGEAEVDCLRPGVFVKFTGELDKKGNLKAPIEAFEMFTAEGKANLGLFAAGDEDASAKPLRNPGAGSYLIRGKLASFRDGSFTVVAGRTKLSGKVADDVKVTVTLDDLSVAQSGDKVEVKAWYYDQRKPNTAFNRPGLGKAQEITVTLSKPLEATGKKSRQTARPAKSSSKSSRLSK